MKFLKILLYTILVLVVIVVILMFVAPTKMEASRSVTINAPKEVVWSNICSLQKQNVWGPWGKKDPNMKVVYTGEDCTVGSKSAWTSEEKEVGAGEQTITKIDPMKRVDNHINFHEPYESEADGYMSMDEDGQGVKVTWGFKSSMPRPMNIMGLFMNMENMVGDEFTEGLNNLKAISEKAAAEPMNNTMMNDTTMMMENDSMGAMK